MRANSELDKKNKKIGRKRRLVKKFRRLDSNFDGRENDNIIRVAVPKQKRIKRKNKNLLIDDFEYYKNWRPTSLDSYEQSYAKLQERVGRIIEDNKKKSVKPPNSRRKPKRKEIDRNDYAAAVINLFAPKPVKQGPRKYKRQNQQHKTKQRYDKKSGVNKKKVKLPSKSGPKPKPPLPPTSPQDNLIAPPPPPSPSPYSSTSTPTPSQPFTVSTTNSPIIHVSSPKPSFSTKSQVSKSQYSMNPDKQDFTGSNSMSDMSDQQNKQKQQKIFNPVTQINGVKHETVGPIHENLTPIVKDIYSEKQIFGDNYDTNFDINISDQKFLVNPIVTFEEDPSNQLNKNDIIKRENFVASNVITYPSGKDMYENALSNNPPLAFLPTQTANPIRITNSYSHPHSDSIINYGNKENLQSDMNKQTIKRKERKLENNTALSRRQAFLGPSAPIIKQTNEMNKDNHHSFLFE